MLLGSDAGSRAGEVTALKQTDANYQSGRCGAPAIATMLLIGTPCRGTNVTVGWATPYITKLLKGEVVSFRPRGNSMKPKIESGQLCTVEPVDPAILEVGDIVLCKVRAAEYLHLIKAKQDGRFQIGNNRGGINGWIGPKSIFGRLIRVED